MLATGVALAASCGLATAAGAATDPQAALRYEKTIVPLLEKYCYDCHGNGLNKGKVTLDEFTSLSHAMEPRGMWLAALRNVRAGLMPPLEKDAARPNAAEIDTLTQWIKSDVFGLDPKQPDPGAVTVRRLNRVEYRNTIRDLMGYDFNSEVEFPPDDSGNGFDNNGDVLTVSPLLLEKYLAAAETIVDKAVPKVAKMVRERSVSGREFRAENGPASGDNLNARRAAKVVRAFTVDKTDKYHLALELESRGSFDFDASRCKVICRIDGVEVFTEDVVWSERRTMRHELDLQWTAGKHVVSFEIVPLDPSGAPLAAETAVVATGAKAGAESRRSEFRPQPATNVTVRIASATLRGPLSPEHWQVPENHARFFPAGAAPADAAGRDRYARELLGDFTRRAYRRPAEPGKVDQLVAMAREVYVQPGRTFEEGMARAMMAVLGSPRFLFRVEGHEPAAAGAKSAPVDEWALATRLSYFLWSTMPDDELFGLAARGELRKNLRAQLNRMLQDPKAQAFVRNFTGQWLQARDVESVPINARAVLGPNAPRNRDGRIEFDGTFRRMMRSETEMYFEHLIREDRSVLELVDSDYTFLNEKLATHYGVPGVTGDNLRKVQLPPGSPRGGVLTQGTVLAVTSNPTRTSPVKRGLFILENILGTPPPPAPPNVPDLEEAKKEFGGREPKLSEMLAVHRSNKLCASCHARMDSLGLALENFNALGGWRDKEAGQPIEPAGELITGEKFADVRELKRVLVRDRKHDIYHCMAEKLLTYALGRGLEYYDTPALDEITERLVHAEGKMSALMAGVVESAPFQRTRVTAPAREARAEQ